MKKSYIFLPIALAFLILAVFGVNKLAKKLNQPMKVSQEVPVIMENPELTNPPKEEPVAVITEEAPEKETLPIKHLNVVAFSSQAPYAKWDDLHDEACEEASLIMAHEYLQGTEEIEIRDAEDEIQRMVKFQKNYFGSHKDLTAQEMVKLAQELYEENHRLITLEEVEPLTAPEEKIESTEEEIISAVDEENKDQIPADKLEMIKKELSEGNIFIIPAAGRELENPYFRSPGPLYHALVIVGYDDNTEEFITHDPGTRRGENYRYSYDILWDSIHDFPGKKTEILKGNKTIILVEKK